MGGTWPRFWPMPIAHRGARPAGNGVDPTGHPGSLLSGRSGSQQRWVRYKRDEYSETPMG